MSSTKQVICTAVAASMLLAGCGGKESPVAPNKPAQLAVDVQSLKLSDDQSKARIIVSNAGDDRLEWRVSGQPDWLALSKTSGSIVAGADTIFVTADTQREDGEYSGEIAIDSNGGKIGIQAKLIVKYGINIFPGVGAGEIVIADTYGRVRQQHGAPDRIDRAFVVPPTGSSFWLHIVVYKSLGLSFVYATGSSTLESSAPTQLIDIASPYRGKTRKLIEIGSLLIDVKIAYGPPKTIDRQFKFYEYPALGIDFGYDANETKVVEMFIYKPQQMFMLGISRDQIRQHLREIE